MNAGHKPGQFKTPFKKGSHLILPDLRKDARIFLKVSDGIRSKKGMNKRKTEGWLVSGQLKKNWVNSKTWTKYDTRL